MVISGLGGKGRGTPGGQEGDTVYGRETWESRDRVTVCSVNIESRDLDLVGL